jgi:hypothetical protein
MGAAERAAGVHAGNRNLAALAVAGSVGADIADRFSDLELDCYWVRPPTDADRLAPVRALGGELTALWDYDQDDQEWSEDYLVGERGITVSNFLVSSVEQFRIVGVPPFKWGYRGTGPDCLASAIEYACCSDLLDKAPGRDLRRARARLDAAIKDDSDPWGIGITLESVIEKTPAGETLEIRIGQIRGWYAEALAKAQRPWWETDLPP